MSLFQKSVTTKYLQSQDKDLLNHKWKDFTNHFQNSTIQENIRNSKEEQYQEGFLRDLFVTVLGYTLNPDKDFNLTTELKNVKDSKKADGAILINDKVKAVIELKGTNTTDLGKIEAQAFGYKNNQKDCTYVITSNFEKLRFYIDNAIDFLEFNLFTLSKNEFDLLYLCLAYQNIKDDLAKKIKDESISQEDVITKKLYKDYSLFKRELYDNLVRLNPQFEPLELFKKSQKLLDRFLFIFFAEDRNLLPTNLIFRINAEWKQLKEMRIEVSLYDRYKVYFNDLNSGAKVSLPAFRQSSGITKEEHQIFAYNGGLFKEDELLNSLRIDDDLLYRHTEKLSHYDFLSEVDVNILGHIFENSLNEIDEIKATMEQAPLAKKDTKRKKDGVFYTPKYITKYIVENTVGKLCEEKKNEFQIKEEDYISDKKRTKATKQPLLDKLTNYRNWLLQITICDPACGSGAFLNQALEFLIAEHRYIDELQAKLFGDALILSDIEQSILENNLYGVDLNEESVQIARLSLWLRTAQPNRKLNDLSNNIKCGNSLIDDTEIAGDKAFVWEKEFPAVFKEKNKKPWHITTALHDSRTSQRMIDYKVRERRDLGTNPFPNVKYLEQDEEQLITQTVYEITKEDNLNVLAFNVCRDHIHLLLVCEEDEVTRIVQKIKSKTARAVNLKRGIATSTAPTTMELAPLSKSETETMELAPLKEENTSTMEQAPLSKEKKKSTPFWTQKFGCKEVTSEEQLYNTISYIEKNRTKHELPEHEKQTKWYIENMVCDLQKAFDTEYKGGFDVIIGNPPYGVRFDEVTKSYLTKFDALVPDFEIYIYFISLYKKILKEKGILSYIFPNTFLSTLFGKNYREEIFSKVSVNEIVDLSNDNTFVDASVRTIIFTFTKNEIDYTTNFLKVEDKQFQFLEKYKKEEVLEEIENVFSLFSQSKSEKIVIEKIRNNQILSVFFEVSQGLIPYDKYRGHDEFTIKNRIWHSDFQKDETYKKELKGGDVNAYSVIWNGNLWISYGTWLAAPREQKFFTQKRILIREITNDRLQCGYTDLEFYNTPSLINIIDEKGILDLKYTLVILNSNLIGWYHNKTSPKANKGLFPKILVNDVRKLPIKISENQQPFIEKADLMLLLNKELQSLVQKFQRSIEREFSLDKLSNKLQNWSDLSYKDFLSELKKSKIELSLSQKAEWEDYFVQEQQKAQHIKNQIHSTDKEIDLMVYQLYGLTQEEIEIVEKV